MRQALRFAHARSGAESSRGGRGRRGSQRDTRVSFHAPLRELGEREVPHSLGKPRERQGAGREPRQGLLGRRRGLGRDRGQRSGRGLTQLQIRLFLQGAGTLGSEPGVASKARPPRARAPAGSAARARPS